MSRQTTSVESLFLRASTPALSPFIHNGFFPRSSSIQLSNINQSKFQRSLFMHIPTVPSRVIRIETKYIVLQTIGIRQ
uniref:Uncharacterized protein n=1 Tax=Anguilla anguilla TaxID=7936 RepID=A0A0E9PSR9_ANGAN